MASTPTSALPCASCRAAGADGEGAAIAAVAAAAVLQRRFLLAPEHLPYRRSQKRREQAEDDPRGARTPLPRHHRAAEQAAADDADSRPGEHHAGQRGLAPRRELRQAPARRLQQHVGADHAGGEAQRRPGPGPGQRHGQGEQGGGDEAATDDRRPVGGLAQAEGASQPGVEGAEQRADQIAEVVRARQPARVLQVDDAVVQHHRHDRREGEAADAHRHGEGGEAGEGDAQRRQVRGARNSHSRRWKWCTPRSCEGE
jgi:hypothetical protein